MKKNLKKLFALLLFFGKTLALEGTLLALLQLLCRHLLLFTVSH